MKPDAKYFILLIAGFGILFAMLKFTSNMPDPSTQPPKEQLAQVTIYTKPGCSYCDNAKILLTKHQIFYKAIDLTNQHSIVEKLVATTNQTTVPYVFIEDRFIGGYQELQQLIKQGQLISPAIQE